MAWHFVTLPEGLADEIEDFGLGGHHAFKSVRVEVIVGETTWKTSLFPDKRAGSYVLPIKKEVREANGLSEGDTARITIRLLV